MKNNLYLFVLGMIVILGSIPINAMRTSPRMAEQVQTGIKAASTYYRNPLATRALSQGEIKRSASDLAGQPKVVQVSTKQVLDRISTQKLLETLEQRGMTAERAAKDIQKIKEAKAKKPEEGSDIVDLLILGGLASAPFVPGWIRERNRQRSQREMERELPSYQKAQEESRKRVLDSSRRATTKQTPYEWEW